MTRTKACAIGTANPGKVAATSTLSAEIWSSVHTSCSRSSPRSRTRPAAAAPATAAIPATNTPRSSSKYPVAGRIRSTTTGVPPCTVAIVVAGGISSARVASGSARVTTGVWAPVALIRASLTPPTRSTSPSSR